MNQRQAKRVACAALANAAHHRQWLLDMPMNWSGDDEDRFLRAMDDLINELLSRSGCSETKNSMEEAWEEVRDGL